jgi:hypothetical protein
MVLSAIDETGITKEAIAQEMGRDLSTLYRMLANKTVSKPNVYALVRAVNKLSMFQAINESAALKAAGYEPDSNGMPDNPTIVAIIDLAAHLPANAQLDLLEIAKGLHRRHAK